MWPVSGNGVDVGYGIDGSGLYLPHMSPESPWYFPRCKGKGYRFYDTGSKVLIPPIEFNNNEVMSSVKKSSTNEVGESWNDMYLPGTIARNYAVESSTLSSARRYDPTQGDLLSLGGVFESGAVRKGLLCVDGISSGTAVKFATIGKRPDGPVLKNQMVIDLKSRVMQVQLFNGSDSFCPYGLVRTAKGTKLLRIEKDRKFQFDPSAMREIDLYSGIPGATNTQVYSCFSPFSWKSVAVIDDVGTWRINDITNVGIRQVDTGVPHPSYLQHSSRWNKILWGRDSNFILVGNRLHARLIDRRSVASNELYRCEYGKEVICDMASTVSGYDQLLLTSERLIWTDTRFPGSAVLKWRHHINSNDTSTKLATCDIEGVTTAVIHSQLMTSNVVYQFKRENDLPLSAEDPYHYLTNPEIVTQTVALQPISQQDSVHQEVWSFRFSNDFGLICQKLSTDDTKVEKHPQKVDRMILSKGYKRGKRKAALYRVRNFHEIYKLLFPELPERISSAYGDEPHLQAFASELSQAITKLHKDSNRNIYTLSELAKPKFLFDDIKHLEALIDGLRVHYSKTSLEIMNLDANARTMFPHGVDSAQTILQLLNEIWLSPLARLPDGDLLRARREKHIYYVTAILVLALSGAHSKKYAAKRTPLQQVLGTGPSKSGRPLKPATRKLLGEWEGRTEDYQWFKFGIDDHEKNAQILESQMASMPLLSAPQLTQQNLEEALPLTVDAPRSQASASQRTPARSQRKRKRKEGFV